LIERLFKAAGRKGFGNAREARKQLELSTQSAMSRLANTLTDTNMIIEPVDIIGAHPMKNEKLDRIQDIIDSKTGWVRIKKTMRDLIELCGSNYDRQIAGEPPHDIFLNRMFLGNPGKCTRAI